MLRLNLSWPYWKRIPKWLAEPTNFWVFAAGVLLASLLGDWSVEIFVPEASREDKIRYAGWILDVLGLAWIAIGISSKLDRLQGKSLFQLSWSHLSEWLGSFPLLRKDRVVHIGAANIQLAPAVAYAFGKTKANPDWSLEQKLEWLLNQHDGLVDNVHALTRTLREKEKALSSRIKDLESQIAMRINDLENQTAEIHVGHVGKEFVGLSWVFVGITFATIPDFIETAFNGPIRAFIALGAAALSLV